MIRNKRGSGSSEGSQAGGGAVVLVIGVGISRNCECEGRKKQLIKRTKSFKVLRPKGHTASHTGPFFFKKNIGMNCNILFEGDVRPAYYCKSNSARVRMLCGKEFIQTNLEQLRVSHLATR